MSCHGSSEQRIRTDLLCESCGGPTCVTHIEPHKRLKRRHVWTVECCTCGAVQTADLPKPLLTH